MLFETPRCPECGDPAWGTSDTIPGIALFDGDPTKEDVDYCGETEVCWDGQRNRARGKNRIMLACRCGNEWVSKVIPQPTAGAS